MHNVMPYKSETNDILTECFDDSIVRSCGGRCTCSEVTAASEQLTENICLEVAAAGRVIAATGTSCGGMRYIFLRSFGGRKSGWGGKRTC